jgi:hypothetical protein
MENNYSQDTYYIGFFFLRCNACLTEALRPSMFCFVSIFSVFQYPGMVWMQATNDDVKYIDTMPLKKSSSE